MYREADARAHAQLTNYRPLRKFPPLLFSCLAGVLGQPLHVPHTTENPSDEDVARMLTQLVEAMEQLFEEYKGDYGWEAKTLLVK